MLITIIDKFGNKKESHGITCRALVTGLNGFMGTLL
jgi:hypothetical protein